MPLNIFACFCNISFVFMHFCVFVCCALRVAFVACVGTMHSAWYWYACHASHHRHMIIMLFIMLIMLIIVDHHHVLHSLFIDC